MDLRVSLISETWILQLVLARVGSEAPQEVPTKTYSFNCRQNKSATSLKKVDHHYKCLHCQPINLGRQWKKLKRVATQAST